MLILGLDSLLGFQATSNSRVKTLLCSAYICPKETKESTGDFDSQRLLLKGGEDATGVTYSAYLGGQPFSSSVRSSLSLLFSFF